MKRPTIIGNLHVTEGARVVEIRLVTDHDGIARFGYGELKQVAAFLGKIKAPHTEEDDDDDYGNLI